ncbi:MAG: hypothetical protein FJ128_08535 [Deltaproteobacteria bacterium]|nr:hypothetical protein [Deltaproteobacteria bacterium]
MKRNKRTTVKAHDGLTPLTEHILATMGQEGAAIRKRLKTFYRERGMTEPLPLEQPVDTPVCEMT